MVKTPNTQLELIYARASSSPGPGHYKAEVAGSEIGGKVMKGILKKKWFAPKKKPFDFKALVAGIQQKPMNKDGSMFETTDEKSKTVSSLAVTVGGATFDLD
jgi:hypothetical protein